MKKIYSKVDPEKLLHVVNRLSDITGRDDIIPEDNFIQCATLKMPKDKTFPPHKHITKDRHYPEQIAQESWVVIKGMVRCIFYDIDDNKDKLNLLMNSIEEGSIVTTLEEALEYILKYSVILGQPKDSIKELPKPENE